MATIFSAPTIGEPRAVGIKNGGIQQVEERWPHSRLHSMIEETGGREFGL
jgi:hypothetical protein